SSAFSDEEERFILNNTRPLTPLVLNPVHRPSCWDIYTPAYEPPVNREMEPIPRLPTPEERMRQQAEAVPADIVPINITGASFDRQASFRKVVSNTDSLSRQPRNLSRRKTVTGIPDDVTRKLDSPLASPVLPGQFSTVGRTASSSCKSAHQQKDKEEEVQRGEVREEGRATTRRIRAPRGRGMSSLMASLTSSQPVDSCQDLSSEVHSLPRLATNSSLNSEASCSSTSYRTLSASSSCCQAQDLQGFPSDLQPLLPFDPTARVIPQSPSASYPSSPVTSSSPSSPGRALLSEWSYPSDKPLNEAGQHRSSPSSSHYLSSSSIADSESQFSYQALDDQTPTQEDTGCSYDGSSYSEEMWNYQALSSSSSVHSCQTGGDLNGEGWNCDPLISSGRSTPSQTDRNSLCSEKTTSSLSVNREKRKYSNSSSYSHTITRSISLRKSKRPPPPPLRSDSLRRRPGRSKPLRSSCSPRPERSPHLEHTTQQTPTPSPQTFDDPWVPRSNTKRRQSGFNCGTVTTFEPLSLDSQAATSTDDPPPEQPPPSPSHPHAHVFAPESPGSEEEALRFTLHPQPAASSVAGLQRLASPSSGYSSQSNTPTPGTPVSSPLSPSSPLIASPGALSLPPPSPFSSLHSPSSPAVSSMPRTTSRVEGRPKPAVPERKSSLFSSLSSSYSSTSSLSSCTSSDSSAKHPLLPALPSPPPLPECSSPLPPVFHSPIRESPRPAPPLPPPCLPAPSFTKLSAAALPSPPPSSLPPP
ncbi:NHS-like protein 1, partial [Plectropomus leopardus]|uniref:NHS-like protein 1 n=1 Tax=Plectropomus leopardus TaxID=160734 RepID=UPI001C4BE082